MSDENPKAQETPPKKDAGKIFIEEVIQDTKSSDDWLAADPECDHCSGAGNFHWIGAWRDRNHLY